MTPEGYVKRELKRQLAKYEKLDARWPVTRGMGSPFLDVHCVVNGYALAIECKAPGEGPTRRQRETIEELWAAGAVVLVYRFNDVVHHEDCATLRTVLDALLRDDRFEARSLARSALRDQGVEIQE